MANGAYSMPHDSSDLYVDAAGKRMYHLESGLHTDGQPWHSMAQRDAHGVLSAVLVYRYWALAVRSRACHVLGSDAGLL